MAEVKRTRKSIDDKIAELEKQLKDAKLVKKEQAKKKSAKLGKESIGIAEAIAAIEAAAKANNSTQAEVIKAIASLKRTGLTITNAVRKAKNNNN